MYTGLVEETGVVVECRRDARSARLTVSASLVCQDVNLGDSVAVNGCCLTVVALEADRLTFDAVPETLARTNLGELKSTDVVNLERPLKIGARLGGHFVQGHIDGVGIVRSVVPIENAVVIEIEAPPSLLRYMIEKGSVTVDGVSLTVAEVFTDAFSVWTIPHTREVTTLGCRSVGDRVNLECDMLAKYIERMLIPVTTPTAGANP